MLWKVVRLGSHFSVEWQVRNARKESVSYNLSKQDDTPETLESTGIWLPTDVAIGGMEQKQWRDGARGRASRGARYGEGPLLHDGRLGQQCG